VSRANYHRSHVEIIEGGGVQNGAHASLLDVVGEGGVGGEGRQLLTVKRNLHFGLFRGSRKLRGQKDVTF